MKDYFLEDTEYGELITDYGFGFMMEYYSMEKYLEDNTFFELFQIEKGEFQNLPKWKQRVLKKTYGLF